MIVSFRRAALFAMLSAPLIAAPVLAQDSEPAPAVTIKGIGAGSYTASDLSFYTTDTTGYEGEHAVNEITLSMSDIRPLDKSLLEWSSQKPHKVGKRSNLTLSVRYTDDGGEAKEVVYELTNARAASFSASHSGYSTSANISLQIAAEKLTIDGVEMN